MMHNKLGQEAETTEVSFMFGGDGVGEHEVKENNEGENDEREDVGLNQEHRTKQEDRVQQKHPFQKRSDAQQEEEECRVRGDSELDDRAMTSSRHEGNFEVSKDPEIKVEVKEENADIDRNELSGTSRRVDDSEGRAEEQTTAPSRSKYQTPSSEDTDSELEVTQQINAPFRGERNAEVSHRIRGATFGKTPADLHNAAEEYCQEANRNKHSPANRNEQSFRQHFSESEDSHPSNTPWRNQAPWEGHQSQRTTQQRYNNFSEMYAQDEALTYTNPEIRSYGQPSITFPQKYPFPPAPNILSSRYGMFSYPPPFVQSHITNSYEPDDLPTHGYHNPEQPIEPVIESRHPARGYHMPKRPANPTASPRTRVPSKRKAEAELVEDYEPSSGNEEVDESDESDDEPLMTRIRRSNEPAECGRPVVESNSESQPQSPYHTKSNPDEDCEDEDAEEENEENEEEGTHLSLAQTPHPTIKAPADPAASQDPLPNAQPSVKTKELLEEISFKLPPFNVEVIPLKSSEDFPSVQVSVPGMPRETLLLTPDHAAQEIHLLKNLFIPGQQALSTPDPQPLYALLNFHTITTMVLEAYAAYEAGDLITLGNKSKSSAYNANAEDDQEVLDSQRDALDADTNEIFFATMDRWRVGLTEETRKPAYELIRGVQEFCDIALDVIYYISQHGFIEGPTMMRKERSDKGSKKGKKEEGGKAGKGATAGSRKKATASGSKKASSSGNGVEKRGPGRPRKEETARVSKAKSKKVNTLTGRKKSKTTQTSKKEPLGTVSVVRRGGKGE
ncbi:hypothetical protein N0V90_008689 [Kalmusia sp. IMI 367209]|nr:hypothetical protein N0V90_008689 [Kalmusia sp. IMI 367209]